MDIATSSCHAWTRVAEWVVVAVSLSIASACGGVAGASSKRTRVVGADASSGSGGTDSGAPSTGRGGPAGSAEGGTPAVRGAGGWNPVGAGGIPLGGAASGGGLPAGGGTAIGVPAGQYQHDAGVVCTWTAPSFPVSDGPCTPWAGGNIRGISGLAACPCAGSPQHLAYGMTNYNPGTTVTGPQALIYDGQIISCSYDIIWDSSGSVSTGWLSLPYFGGGFGRLTIPTGLVSAARAKCVTSPGPPVGITTFAAAAGHLIGAWITCPSIPTPQTGSVLRYDGIILHPDGSYQALAEDGTDHFAPVDDCDSAGLWGLDPAQIKQLDLFMGGAESPLIWSAYSGSQRRIILDDTNITMNLVALE